MPVLVKNDGIFPIISLVSQKMQYGEQYHRQTNNRFFDNYPLGNDDPSKNGAAYPIPYKSLHIISWKSHEVSKRSDVK